jgi:hypothetical protein
MSTRGKTHMNGGSDQKNIKIVAELVENMLGSTVSTIKNKKKDSKKNTKVISEIINDGIQYEDEDEYEPVFVNKQGVKTPSRELQNGNDFVVG